jgi:pectin methylesterase-like acyl-CoA thioesterase
MSGPKMTAAVTPTGQQPGFLFVNSRIESTVSAGSAFLGRLWPTTPNALTHVTVRDSWLPAPWQNWTNPPVALARQANRVLFCDTTTIWSNALFGTCPAWLYAPADEMKYSCTW